MSNELKLGVVCYLPPRRLYPTDAFLENLKDFPARHPLVFFSDDDYGDGVVKLGGNVELARSDVNKMAVRNIIFFIAVRMAANHRFTHMMLLENDCRVIEPGWDDIIWREFQSKNRDAIVGGSMVFFDPCAYSQDASRRYERFVIETSGTRKMPLSMTGSGRLGEKLNSCVFPNGAFAIYRMDWMLKVFPEIASDNNMFQLARTCRAWDYEVGVRLWNQFREQTYDVVVQLDSAYSGYGDVISTEADRAKLLTSKTVVGVHQVKSEWRPSKADVSPENAKSSKFNNLTFFLPSPEAAVKHRVEMLIVTYRKDFEYLRLCLRSLSKFLTGFAAIRILVPTWDAKLARTLAAECYTGPVPLEVRGNIEWKGKGMLWAMAQKCRADRWCPQADFIAHWDADCIFTAPVTPDTFFKDNKAILRYEPFESLARRHPGTWNWKVAAEDALPFSVANEGMRGHPELYHRKVYEKTRQLIEQKHKMRFDEYIKTRRNEFPQTFAEFPTLSAVAIEYFADSHFLLDLSKLTNPDRSPYPVVQFWSHGRPDEEQEIWIDGLKRTVIPSKHAEEVLK